MNLLTFLKENKNTRKVFGKRELKIIEKQLKGVNLTQSEKNRLSRDIREKFKFIEQASRFSNEFEIKKGEIIKRMIGDAKEIILNDLMAKEIEKIVLFGSAAENKMHLNSDIDLAVVFNKINLKEATKFRIRVSGKTADNIDVQVFNILPEKIKKEILKRERIIYENKR